MRHLALVFVLVSGAALAQQAPPPAGSFQPPPVAPLPSQPATPPVAAAAAPADFSSVEVAKTAKPTRDVFIGGYITVDRTCKVGETPKVDVIDKPKGGALRTRRDPMNLASAPGIPRNKCLGTSPAAISVVYKSNARFKGDDIFVYRVTYPDGRVREVKGTVTVQ